MRISTRGEYGLRALMELGMEPGVALSLRDIAQRQQISLDYLEQIVPSLKSAGLIKAMRTDITAYDALVALEGTFNPMACLANTTEEGENCLASGSCAVQEVWSDMKTAVEDVLKKKTLATMIERQRESFKVPIRTYTSDSEIMQLVVLN